MAAWLGGGVLGIQSGIVSISERGKLILVKLMEDEHNAIKSPSSLANFQCSLELQELHEELAKELEFKNVYRPLIFIGDVSHDRLSCNKDIDMSVRGNLHKQGAVYIFGNHDSYKHSKRLANSMQRGEGAKNNISKEQWKTMKIRFLLMLITAEEITHYSFTMV
ncbi:hypothetical protein ACET8U_22810 [Aeromonas veronii]